MNNRHRDRKDYSDALKFTLDRKKYNMNFPHGTTEHFAYQPLQLPYAFNNMADLDGDPEPYSRALNTLI